MDARDRERLARIRRTPLDEMDRGQAQALMEIHDEGDVGWTDARDRLDAIDLDERVGHLGSYERGRARVLRCLAAAAREPGVGTLARLQGALEQASEQVSETQLERVFGYLERTIPEVIDAGSDDWEDVKKDARVVLDHDEPRGAEAAALRRLM